MIVGPLEVEELRGRRLRAGWGQRAVAKRLRVDQTSISAWETRRRPIPLAQAVAYAALLDDIEAGHATP